MATNAENLQTALDNVAAQLADVTANPKPTYSVAGRSVSWGEHFNNLQKAYADLKNLLIQEQGPFMVRVRGRQAR